MHIQHSTQHSKKTIFASLPLFISLLTISLPFSSVSADTNYEVQSGDSLSKIIAKNYPDVAKQSYSIIMQHTLKNNPDAFSNKNINSLRLGKTLVLTAKEDIEGLKPKPPAPTPVNPEEFKKLQSQNSDLQEQIKTLKAELEKLQESPASNTTKTTSDAISDTSNTVQQEKINALQTEVEELLAKIKKLETEKQELTTGSTSLTEQQKTQLEEAQALTKQLQTQITTLEAEKTELSKADNAEIEKKLADTQAESAQLKEKITTLEAEKQQQTKLTADLQAANKQVEDLQAKVEQLNSLITKYETDQKDNTQTETSTAKLEDLQAKIDLLEGLAKKNEADQEESDALIEQLKEQIANSDNSTKGSSDNVANSKELDKLRQENSLLQAEIEKAKEKSNQDNNTIGQLKSELAATTSPASTPNTLSTSPATEAPTQQPEPSSWLKLSMLSWLLPLLAILIGLYLLSRLIKRNRDKRATEDFKTAMATSASSNTAAAFGIDGSAPSPHNESESSELPKEEDSLEAEVKIDMAKAYIDLNETDAANEMLQEAMIEGSSSQKEAAEKLLK